MESNTQKLIHSFGALADLGQEVADSGDFMEMVRTSLHLLLGTLAIRRGAIVECPAHLEMTNPLALWGLSEDYDARFVVDEETKDAFLNSAKGAFEVSQPGATKERALDAFFAAHQPEYSVQLIELIVPMIVRGELTGLVLLGGKASGESFTPDDLEVIQAMVRHIGVGIHTHRLLAEVKQQSEENRRLYFDLRTIYRDTVRAFAAAIDIKDKYTQGHSERVGKYSEIIAREMGWGEEEVEGMAIAGYLHDVGKLVVERDIINAPYKIDAKQSSELNRHPGAGFDILSPIHHPFADIPLMAKYHHERLDGRGYPDGLTDLQIPIGAKIVSLADSFDAMTTDRPYKTRRTFDEVIHDLRRNTGTQFEPIVVAAFCRALFKELNGETKERKFLKMLGKNYLDAERDKPLLVQLLSELDPSTQTATAGGV
ncbi:MAG TPA: HD domain-containing phosphohydrolase [Pyrinomonadaceae bacterium]|jgi:HD-GYP domain-containing protein (c-di-GMP phosphodiesterase class II)|nr:HD domain-containing phosphohydrolase [Pyrinomonadaceae bacterium]